MKDKYFCPMHKDVTSDKPGKCPKCGMRLVSSNESLESSKTQGNSYTPLVVIVGIIALVAVATSGFVLRVFIEHFMAGFFLVFAGFKLIDLPGFVEGYSTYDLLAQRAKFYGYLYPFIELLFGLLMILGNITSSLLLAEITVMSFSGVGVLIKLAKHEKFQCVCLGTAFKLPLTYVTLIEDFGMAALAVVLLLM